MKHEIRLTPTNASARPSLGFNPVALAVMNNSPYSVLVRRGSNELPTSESYDYLVPSGMFTTIAVVGNYFALALDTENPETASYEQPATCIFYDEHEALPQFGNSSYRLATAKQFTGSFSHTIDVRGARALSLEFYYDPLDALLYPTNVNTGDCIIRTGNKKDGSDFRMTQALNTPFSTHMVRAIIPVSASYMEVSWTPRNAALSSELRYTLLDTVPTTTPLSILQRTVQEFTLTDLPVGVPVGVFSDWVRGTLQSVNVKIDVPRGDPYEVYLSIIVIQPGVMMFFPTVDLKFRSAPLDSTDDVQIGGQLAKYLIDLSRDTLPVQNDVYRYHVPLSIRSGHHVEMTVINETPTLSGLTLHASFNLEVGL